MDRTVFFACALVFCVLPSAFGLTCKMCMPNITTLTLCNTDSQLTEGPCPTVANTTYYCTRLDISAELQSVPYSTYFFGCFGKPNGVNITCDVYASNICESVRNQTGDMSATCSGSCCATNNCNDIEFSTVAMPTNATTTPSGSGPTTIPTSLSQLLFLVIMASLYFGLK